MKKLFTVLLCGIISVGLWAQTGSGSIYGASGSGTTGAVSADWVLGSLSADGSPGAIALPVQFGAISAAITNQQLLVKWTTETETNNDHFDIEVSADGTQFKKIASVVSKAPEGAATTPLQYEYQTALAETALALSLLFGASLFVQHKRNKHPVIFILLLTVMAFTGCSKKDLQAEPAQGDLYIRIAQVDKEGTKQYSKIIKATREH